MSKVKKEHTVPVSYLERFCIEDLPNIIYCYDKLINKEYTSNISDVAFRFYFYDIEQGDKQRIEKNFSKKEGKWRTAISSLIKKGDPKRMSSNQKNLIFEFVIAQLLRTVEKRNHLLEHFHHLYPKEELTLNQEEYDEFVNGFIDRGVRIAHSELIDNILKYTSLISDYHMHLFINKTSIPLKVSDNPVNTYNLFKGKSEKINGLANDDIELYIPLNPWLMLCIANPKTHEAEPRVNELTKEGVIERNRHQTRDCNRQIFSPMNDFQDEKLFLEKFPEFTNKNRIRRNIWNDEKIELIKYI